jgi:RNA polymerase sigma factor (sigma-70 family)
MEALFGFSQRLVWKGCQPIERGERSTPVSASDKNPTPEQLDILNDVIRHVARTGRLQPQDVEDFSQSVHVKLLERNYDVFARFDGRSSLRTFLTVVIRRLLLDWRNAAQGKWRSSAAATRLGAMAVALERLIYRDAFQASEAIQLLRSRGCMESTAELQELWNKLPRRASRRTISDERLVDVSATAFEDPVDAERRRRARRRVAMMLARVIRELPQEDQWLLQARYQRTQSIQAVAGALQVDPKALYRRFDRVLRSLRRSLESAGLTESQMH